MSLARQRLTNPLLVQHEESLPPVSRFQSGQDTHVEVEAPLSARGEFIAGSSRGLLPRLFSLHQSERRVRSALFRHLFRPPVRTVSEAERSYPLALLGFVQRECCRSRCPREGQ